MFNSLFTLLSSSVCKCHHTHLDIQNSQWTGLKAMQFHLPWSLPSFMHGEKCLEHCRWHHYAFFFLSAAEMVCKEKSCWPKWYGLQWVSVVAGGIFNLCCGMWESLVAACRIFFFFKLWHANSWLWHVGSRSLIRDQTWAPCIGSMES